MQGKNGLFFFQPNYDIPLLPGKVKPKKYLRNIPTISIKTALVKQP